MRVNWTIKLADLSKKGNNFEEPTKSQEYTIDDPQVIPIYFREVSLYHRFVTDDIGMYNQHNGHFKSYYTILFTQRIVDEVAPKRRKCQWLKSIANRVQHRNRSFEDLKKVALQVGCSGC